MLFRLRTTRYHRTFKANFLNRHIINYYNNNNTIMKLKSLALVALCGALMQNQVTAQGGAGGGAGGTGQAQPGQAQPGQAGVGQPGVGQPGAGQPGTVAPNIWLEGSEDDEEYTLVEPEMEQTEATRPQQQQAQPGAAPTESGQATGQVGWDGSNHRQVRLDEIEAKVRAAFQNASRNSEIDPGVTRIDYHGREVFRAREILPDTERYLYVDGMGDLVKIQEPISMEAAPQMVRTAAQQQQRGATGAALMRETQGNTTHYILRVTRQGQPLRWIQMDEAGNIMKSVTQEDFSAPQADTERTRLNSN